MYELNAFNSLSDIFIMILNQDKTDSSYDLVDKNDFFKYIDKIENSTCLYPNGYRITYHNRLLKVSLDKAFEIGISA